MELKEFISETIKQITDGVLEGDSYVKSKSNSSEGIRNQYTKINFDIAVASNNENKEGMPNTVSVIQVFNIGENSKSGQNRIQFELLAAINTE